MRTKTDSMKRQRLQLCVWICFLYLWAKKIVTGDKYDETFKYLLFSNRWKHTFVYINCFKQLSWTECVPTARCFLYITGDEVQFISWAKCQLCVNNFSFQPGFLEKALLSPSSDHRTDEQMNLNQILKNVRPIKLWTIHKSNPKRI